MPEEIITNSPEETIAWGRGLAKRLRPPVLVLLSGELGSGKTTLTKGIVAGLNAATEDEVTSPTFTLIHEYGDPVRIYHVDLYRLDTSEETRRVGLEELFERPALTLIEWGERFLELMPEERAEIRIEYVGEDRRTITLSFRAASTKPN